MERLGLSQAKGQFQALGTASRAAYREAIAIRKNVSQSDGDVIDEVTHELVDVSIVWNEQVYTSIPIAHEIMASIERAGHLIGRLEALLDKRSKAELSRALLAFRQYQLLRSEYEGDMLIDVFEEPLVDQRMTDALTIAHAGSDGTKFYCKLLSMLAHMKNIVHIIEKEKDLALGSSIIEHGDAMNPTPLSMHGLSAQTAFMTKAELDAMKLGAAHIITRQTRTNIEYDARGLISQEFIDMYPSTPVSGLDENIIARFSTIKSRPASMPLVHGAREITDRAKYKMIPSKPDENVRAHDGHRAPKPIIETYDGQFFRLLARDVNPTILGRLSTRALEYNRIHWERIEKKWTSDRLQAIVLNYTENEALDSLATDIADDLVAKAADKSISSPEDYAALVLDREHMIAILSARLGHVDERGGIEAMVSLVSHINKIATAILSELSTYAYITQAHFDQNQGQGIYNEYERAIRAVLSLVHKSGILTIHDATFKNHVINALN